jgi:hypothetical protein
MTDFTMDELECLRGSLEADIERSSWDAMSYDDWLEVELLEHYALRARVYRKLLEITKGTDT